jgi:hypothetical protein
LNGITILISVNNLLLIKWKIIYIKNNDTISYYHYSLAETPIIIERSENNAIKTISPIAGTRKTQVIIPDSATILARKMAEIPNLLITHGIIVMPRTLNLPTWLAPGFVKMLDAFQGIYSNGTVFTIKRRIGKPMIVMTNFA